MFQATMVIGTASVSAAQAQSGIQFALAFGILVIALVYLVIHFSENSRMKSQKAMISRLRIVEKLQSRYVREG